MDAPRKTSTRLGIYLLQRQLGKGGMGTVYLALDPPLQRLVAIKVLPPQFAADPDYVARFEREATTLAKIRHPNLMHIYAVGCDLGHHYIAMEYIKGRTVNDLLLQEGPIPYPVAIRILGQVLSALDKVHAAGIVHRDLKPGNIMIDEDQRAILMDFGLAKLTHDHSVTTDNTIIGTPEYMAPELAEGKDANLRSDLYALGIVLFEMLTGRVPFRGPSSIATLRQQVEQPVPSPRGLVPDLPPRLDAILAKALAKEPEQRYADCRAFASDLLTLAQTPELAALAAPGAAAPTAPTLPMNGTAAATAPTLLAVGRRRLWRTTAVAVACLLLVLAGAFLAPRLFRRTPIGGAKPTTGASATPGTPATQGPDATPALAASKKVYVVYVRDSEPIRGRLVAISGEKGYIKILTESGEMPTIPYGTVLRIEPQGGQ